MDDERDGRCPDCGGELSASRAYCLACGRPGPRFADGPPSAPPAPRGAGKLADRIRRAGARLLRGRRPRGR